MAKKKSRTAKKLMPAKEITVKSRAYGEHTRAARGNRTPVGINDAFTAQVAKTAVINNVAKRVHNLLKRCSEHFNEAMLWQGILSRMRKATSAEMTDLLMALKGMELNSRYPLSRFIPLFSIKMIRDDKYLKVILSSYPPHFKNEDDQYRYELFLLLLGKDASGDRIIERKGDWIAKEEAKEERMFSFNLTGEKVCWLLRLHLMTGRKGKATDTLASWGMQIIETGELA